MHTHMHTEKKEMPVREKVCKTPTASQQYGIPFFWQENLYGLELFYKSAEISHSVPEGSMNVSKNEVLC